MSVYSTAMATYVDQIIERFGSINKTASALRLSRTTIARWRDLGYIPYPRHPDVIKRSKRTGHPLTDRDFINGGTK